MSIQVCLGEIDWWVIQEPLKNTSFLEETFEKKMETPDANVTLTIQKCSCKTPHDPNEICLYYNCGKKFCEHNNKRCPAPYDWQSFKCRYYQVLMQCNGNGEHKMTFDLDNEKEKTKLKKLLELIALD